MSPFHLGSMVELNVSFRGQQRSSCGDGEMVELTTPIEPDGVGQGRLRGSTWKVQNAGSGALEAGARRRVDEINGITLSVGNPLDELEEIDRWN